MNTVINEMTMSKTFKYAYINAEIFGSYEDSSDDEEEDYYGIDIYSRSIQEDICCLEKMLDGFTRKDYKLLTGKSSNLLE